MGIRILRWPIIPWARGALCPIDDESENDLCLIYDVKVTLILYLEAST